MGSKKREQQVQQQQQKSRYNKNNNNTTNSNNNNATHAIMMTSTMLCCCGNNGEPLSRTSGFRLVFILSLMVAAAITGFVAFVVIEDLERDVGVQTYKSVATSAIEGARAITLRKVQGSDVMASVLSFTFPNASMWPFVAQPGYVQTASKLAKLSASTSLALITLVHPDNATAFENYAAQVYDDHGYPESAGVSQFGFGIYAKSKNSPWDDNRIPDISGNTSYGSTNYLLSPIFQHNILGSKSLLYNVHSEVFRGTAIDSMIECSNNANKSTMASPNCSVVTDFVELIVKPGPAGLLYQPVYPANDPHTMVGFIGTSIHWKEVLMDVVPDYVDGMDCVISTDTATYTYVIDHGEVVLKGEGDLHDERYTDFARSTILNDISTDASASATYTLTVYSTDAMFNEFTTNSPHLVAFGFVGVIFFCSALFFLYDFFMKHESHQRKMILDMKRRFIRFVSHEIRTPLNTVCMGLELLQAEMESEMQKCKELADKAESTPEDTSNHSRSGKVCTNVSQVVAWHQLTGEIMDNSENAVVVLNDLLNFDKIETGSFKLQPGIVEIWDIVDKSVQQFQIQARNRGVELNLQVAQQQQQQQQQGGGGGDGNGNDGSDLRHLKIIGDDVRLSQVIRNLVSNALKFTPEGGVIDVATSHIPKGLEETKQEHHRKDPRLVSEHPRGGSISITVKDTGAGMTPEQLELVFNEGTQFNSNLLQGGGGSGLGMAITKEIVELHGGKIAVHSGGTDKGTTFFVELPLYEFPKKAPDSNKDLSVGALEGGGGDGAMMIPDVSDDFLVRQRNILVVDDALSNRKILVRLLERAGHTCVVARDGQEAIDAFQKSEEEGCPIDTILMDYEMPVLNGPDATKQLRDMGCSATIIGVTGNVLADDVAHFKSQGADGVIPKPVNISKLTSCWENARRGMQQDLSARPQSELDTSSRRGERRAEC